jgi:hypothetical protein
MRMIPFFAACITGLAMLNQTALAQDVPRYQPQRPTVSPYLNLLRNDNGALPNYYSLVRPQLNQQSFDNQILSRAESQARATQKLSDVATKGQSGPTGTSSTFRNFSHFRDRSHFYPEPRRGFQKR